MGQLKRNRCNGGDVHNAHIQTEFRGDLIDGVPGVRER